MQERAECSSPAGELPARVLAQPAGRPPPCVVRGVQWRLRARAQRHLLSALALDSHWGLAYDVMYLRQCMAICCKGQLMGARGRKNDSVLFWS
jgi:hypothetical protein